MSEFVQANICGEALVLQACSRLCFSGEVWNPYAARRTHPGGPIDVPPHNMVKFNVKHRECKWRFSVRVFAVKSWHVWDKGGYSARRYVRDAITHCCRSGIRSDGSLLLALISRQQFVS